MGAHFSVNALQNIFKFFTRLSTFKFNSFFDQFYVAYNYICNDIVLYQTFSIVNNNLIVTRLSTLAVGRLMINSARRDINFLTSVYAR